MKQTRSLLIPFLVAITCLIFPRTVSAQNFDNYCSNERPCDASRFLRCSSDNTCECENPDTQIYDPIESHCVILAGSSCSLKANASACIQGADCDAETNKCKCLRGFYETELNICSYTIGKVCNGNRECDSADGLVCLDGLCKCPNSTYIWQLELGCVTLDDIMEITGGNYTNNSTLSLGGTTNVTSTEGSNLSSEGVTAATDSPQDQEDELPDRYNLELSGGSSTTGPFGFPIVQPGNGSPSVVEDMDDESDNRNSSGLDDRLEGTGGLIGAVFTPIVNLLNPNRNRKPPQTLNPQPIFQSQLTNNELLPAGLRSRPKPQNQNFQDANGGAPSQLEQQKQLNGPDFSRPLLRPQINMINNMRYPGIIRNILTPWRRFLFPALNNEQDFRLPSPIWLAAATVNQFLPVLRALDYQFSPWLQTVARLSRPSYIPTLKTIEQEQQTQQQVYQQQTQQNYNGNNNNVNNKNNYNIFGTGGLNGQQNNWNNGNNGQRPRLFPFLWGRQ